MSDPVDHEINRLLNVYDLLISREDVSAEFDTAMWAAAYAESAWRLNIG